MGLLDILNGMQNGPHGNQSQSGQKSGGMSPIMMALLGLLAFKAIKGGSRPAPSTPTSSGGGLGDILGGLLGGGRPSGVPSGAPSSMPSGTPSSGTGSGGLGDILAGGAGGSILSGGLGNLIKQMQQNGYGRQAQSWVGHGENETIPPDDLGKALGTDDIDRLTQQTGMNRDELLAGLSQHLPKFVDQLTPEGRLPTEKEASEMA